MPRRNRNATVDRSGCRSLLAGDADRGRLKGSTIGPARALETMTGEGR